MEKFSVLKKDLEKALAIIVLATEKSSENIKSHALFDVSEKNKAVLYSTDEDRVAMAVVPFVGETGTFQFTLDPKRMQSLVNNSDSDKIEFTYDQENMTLNVYASEDTQAYVSFASFSPKEFTQFSEELSKATVKKSINTTVLKTGLKFIQGFLANDDKSKFSNLFISNGVMYGSNGTFRIGAFRNPSLDNIEATVLRRAMLSALTTTLDKIDEENVLLKESEKYVVFAYSENLEVAEKISSKDTYCFGFKKSTHTMPKMPVSLDTPTTDGINITKSLILKKLNRFALTFFLEDIGVKMSLKENELTMQTLADRKSLEKLTCKRLGTLEGDRNFVVECNKFKEIINLFQAPDIDLYVDDIKCTFYSDASIVVENKNKDTVTIPFTAIGFLTLPNLLGDKPND